MASRPRTTTWRRVSRPRGSSRTSGNTLSKTNHGAAAPVVPASGVQAGGKTRLAHDKHAEIFSAALKLFQAKGYHGTSMQDLATAVGIQKASLYYYIRSKEELLVTVCERGSGAFTQELNEIVASDLPPTEKLKRAIECHLGALCAQLDLFTVFLHEQKFLGETEKQKLRGEGNRHAELLATILEQGMAAGEFREVNVTVTALAILGMCNWLYEWYSPNGALAPREIAAMFSELALNGLKITATRNQ